MNPKEGMNPKALLDYFVTSVNPGWLDYPVQMKIAKNLVSRYTEKQLITAINLYKGEMYSLGFLNEKNMGRAIVKASEQINIDYEVGGDIAERNRNKLQKFTPERRFRERSYFDMLKE